MNNLKIIAISFLLGALLFLQEGHAAPEILNLAVQEPNLWFGENAVISADCIDTNSSITQVYASISGEGAVFPNMPFSGSSSPYSLAFPVNDLGRRGTFNATVYCQNALSESAYPLSIIFTVSNLSSQVKSVSSSYIGDVAEIGVGVQKNGAALTSASGILFNLAVDGQAIPLQPPSPYYDTDKWTLKFATSSLGSGNHSIAITSLYNRTSSVSTSKIELRQPVEFSVLSIDKTEVQSGNEIVAAMKATDRGVPVAITTSSLSVQVDSTSASIAGISESPSGTYNVRITAPSVSSGTRQLKITLNYGNVSKTETRSITYVVPVSGKLIGSDGKGISAKFTFKSGSSEKTVNTDSSGAYSTYLSPGTYKITLVHEASTLELNDVEINSFDDPIKYQYLPSLDVPGIKEAGVYVYEIALDYSEAYLRMKYDEGKVSDESALNLYSCSNWNSGKKECISGWFETSSSVDTIRNLVSANTTSLHTYAIGTDETVNADAAIDKASYTLNEKIKLSGIVRDSGGSIVAGAEVIATIEGTTQAARTKSDAGGAYSLEIPVPQSEGKYVLVVKIEARPYISSTKRLEFGVAKSRSVSVVAPDVIRLKQGESAAYEFTVVNAGQADISDVKISIKGVPSGYSVVSPESIAALKSGEEKKISVSFNIPLDAAKTTYGASIELSGGYVLSRSFGITVIAPGEQSGAASSVNSSAAGASSVFSFPTAFVITYPSAAETAYILLFAAISFSSALILRKRKLSGTSSSFGQFGTDRYRATRNLLFDIKKKVVEPKKNEEKPSKRKRAGFSRYAGNW